MKKKFKKFLKKHNTYKKYKKNLKRVHNVKLFFDHTSPEDYIISAFRWADIGYWSNLDRLWRAEL